MFSRIFAAELRRGPGRPQRPVLRAEQQHAAHHRQAAVHLDHARDVAAVALAEVAVDVVVDRVELLGRALRSAPRRGGRAGLGSPRRRRFAARWVLGWWWRSTRLLGVRGFQSSISTAPSGAFTQVRTISPFCPVTSPVRRSRTSPERSRPTQVWQMPIRQPKGRVAPASSPATRIGVPPSASASRSDLQNLTVPPSPSPLAADHRLEALEVQPVGIAVLLPVLGQRVEHLARPREEGLALAPVGAELVEVARGPCGPCCR